MATNALQQDAVRETDFGISGNELAWRWIRGGMGVLIGAAVGFGGNGPEVARPSPPPLAAAALHQPRLEHPLEVSPHPVRVQLERRGERLGARRRPPVDQPGEDPRPRPLGEEIVIARW